MEDIKFLMSFLQSSQLEGEEGGVCEDKIEEMLFLT